MSDPVTNVEIEDVLSSIRRLVSDGDKARTRDPAPVEPSQSEHNVEGDSAQPAPEPETSEAKPDRFVLTPALMVVDTAFDDEAAQDLEYSIAETETHAEEPQADRLEPAEPEANETVEDIDNTEEEPFALTEMVFDVESEPEVAPTAEVPSTPDRSNLEATIAELEAAIGSDDEYEPDGSETMGQTIAWPGTTLNPPEEIEDAETIEEADTDAAVAPESEDVLAAQQEEAAQEEAAEDEAAQDEAAQDEAAPAVGEAEPYDDDDDDLDNLLDAGGVAIDEEALRALVAEVVREELTGPLGERITRNVRKLVRREIYRILSSQDFD